MPEIKHFKIRYIATFPPIPNLNTTGLSTPLSSIKIRNIITRGDSKYREANSYQIITFKYTFLRIPDFFITYEYVNQINYYFFFVCYLRRCLYIY